MEQTWNGAQRRASGFVTLSQSQRAGTAVALALLSMLGSGAQAAGKGHPRRTHQILKLKVQLHLAHVQVLGTVMLGTKHGQLGLQRRHLGAKGRHLIGRRDRYRNLQGRALP